MSFPFSPPQGFPSGGGNQPVKVATGTVASSSSTSTFIELGGTSTSVYSASITPPQQPPR